MINDWLLYAALRCLNVFDFAYHKFYKNICNQLLPLPAFLILFLWIFNATNFIICNAVCYTNYDHTINNPFKCHFDILKQQNCDYTARRLSNNLIILLWRFLSYPKGIPSSCHKIFSHIIKLHDWMQLSKIPVPSADNKSCCLVANNC